MGKSSRGKWDRRLVAARQAATIPTKSHGDWQSSVTWLSTLLLNGLAISLSNGPWGITALLFFASVPVAWRASYLACRRIPQNWMRHAVFILVGVLSTGVTYLVANSVMRIPVELDATSRDSFTESLRRVPQKPDFVLLACNERDESSCMFAAQFIPLFQRAGWKVEGPQIERAGLLVPNKDILLVDYGPPLIDPQDPDHGVWTMRLPWRTHLQRAFKDLKIESKSLNDPKLSEKKTRIYFGNSPTRTLQKIISDWYALFA